jgi:hypothetical protein
MMITMFENFGTPVDEKHTLVPFAVPHVKPVGQVPQPVGAIV